MPPPRAEIAPPLPGRTSTTRSPLRVLNFNSAPPRVSAFRPSRNSVNPKTGSWDVMLRQTRRVRSFASAHFKAHRWVRPANSATFCQQRLGGLKIREQNPLPNPPPPLVGCQLLRSIAQAAQKNPPLGQQALSCGGLRMCASTSWLIRCGRNWSRRNLTGDSLERLCRAIRICIRCRKIIGNYSERFITNNASRCRRSR